MQTNNENNETATTESQQNLSNDGRELRENDAFDHILEAAHTAQDEYGLSRADIYRLLVELSTVFAGWAAAEQPTAAHELQPADPAGRRPTRPVADCPEFPEGHRS
jgi:hypothetical protein